MNDKFQFFLLNMIVTYYAFTMESSTVVPSFTHSIHEKCLLSMNSLHKKRIIMEQSSMQCQ